jgi:tetraacyldisaccharide 4'-kinase
MGGSGKTPLVIYLARLLSKNGYRPAIVSRGYRGTSNKKTNIVSDGISIRMTAEQCGDEPCLIARTLPEVIVATGKRRLDPCNEVISRYGCDCIILDDGFQHLALARQIDLVLFDVDHFTGNSRVFPGGDLREPVSALGRATAFVLTGATGANGERAERCASLLQQRFAGIPVFLLSRRFSHVIRYSGSGPDFSEEQVALDELPDNLLCFCGIARPERFRDSLEKHGVSCPVIQTFGDHHTYTEADFAALLTCAQTAGAPGLITTEKDMTKIRSRWPGPLPIFAPSLEIPVDEEFDQHILAQMSTG